MVPQYEPKKCVSCRIETKFVLKDEDRVYQNPTKLAPSEQQIVEQQVKNRLNQKIISGSLSEYTSPIVFIKKEDGSAHFSIDYRRLNKTIVRDIIPFPKIEDGKIRPANAKITAVKIFSKRTNMKHIQSFLGLTGFFRKFVYEYSIIAAPLTDLLKKPKIYIRGKTTARF